MIDAVIIVTFILAGAGTGFHGTDLIPSSLLAQTNVQSLRWLMLGIGAFVGLILGLLVQSGYRRLEAQVRSMPVETLLGRASGLVVGLLVANLMLSPLFLIPIPEDFSFIKPLARSASEHYFCLLGYESGGYPRARPTAVDQSQQHSEQSPSGRNLAPCHYQNFGH